MNSSEGPYNVEEGLSSSKWNSLYLLGNSQVSFLTISIMFVRFHVVSKEPIIERAVGEKSRATANDLINANLQTNTSFLVYFVRRPSLINALFLIDAFLTITVLQKEAKSLNYSVFLLV